MLVYLGSNWEGIVSITVRIERRHLKERSLQSGKPQRILLLKDGEGLIGGSGLVEGKRRQI